MSNKLYMLRGPSGCGKSTHARHMMAENGHLVRVNRDDIRAMSLFGWKPKMEKVVVAIETQAAIAALEQHYDVVVDDTNLSDRHRDTWRDIAARAGAKFEAIDVYREAGCSLDICVDQDALRGDSRCVGRPVIERQFLTGHYIDWGTRPVVVVDMDGTLSDPTHRLHYVSGEHKEFDLFEARCGLDAPVEIVIKWTTLLAAEHMICIVSGRRMDRAGISTTEWLRSNGVPFDHLFMRKSHDSRPDDVVKQEILDEMLASGLPKSQIAFIIDDRPKVIEMWRRNGLRVFPVGVDQRQF